MLKKSSLRFCAFFYGFLMIISACSTLLAVQLVGYGSKGEKVREIQGYLYNLNYLKQAPTGYYGKMTVAAVKSFQIEHGLKCDGKVGAATYDALVAACRKKYTMVEHTVASGETLSTIGAKYRIPIVEIMAKNDLNNAEVVPGQKLVIPLREDPKLVSRSRNGSIQAIPWSIVDQLWERGQVARIIDLRSGRSFQAKRYGGHFHSDVEPLTLQDTQILLGIYGGRWSWERQAVAVQVGNQLIAASINGMPHGGYSIKNNIFDGHFCVHFLGSRLHKNGRIDLEHQSMIKKAASLDWSISEPDERRPEIPVYPEPRRSN